MQRTIDTNAKNCNAIIRDFPGSCTGQWSINSTVLLVMFTMSGAA